MSKKYYVYCAYGVNDEILYIGYGKGDSSYIINED